MHGNRKIFNGGCINPHGGCNILPEAATSYMEVGTTHTDDTEVHIEAVTTYIKDVTAHMDDTTFHIEDATACKEDATHHIAPMNHTQRL